MANLECVIKEPLQTADASIIWLHGLGANGHDFAGIVPELKLPASLNVRFIFPHAPTRPVTLNGGMVMPAWFDIVGLDPQSLAQSKELGVIEAAEAINHLIQQEIDKGIAANRILLAGFSQGGTLAIYCGLTHPQTLGGVIALSTFFPDVVPITSKKDFPMFFAHGVSDSAIPMNLGEKTYQDIRALGMSAEWHTYPMAHSVCADEITAISTFIQKVILNS